MAEIVPVVSEALEAQVRSLLPSQRGFGEDLQASNVITPIIDLTATAEGSAIRQDLQTAISFGGITAFDVQNTTTTLANSPGFYQIFGLSDLRGATAAVTFNAFNITDGLATKQIWQHEVNQGVNNTHSSVLFDFVVFLTTGDSITAQSNSTRGSINGTYRQIADVNGNFVNPVGFTPQ